MCSTLQQFSVEVTKVWIILIRFTSKRTGHNHLTRWIWKIGNPGVETIQSDWGTMSYFRQQTYALNLGYNHTLASCLEDFHCPLASPLLYPNWAQLSSRSLPLPHYMLGKQNPGSLKNSSNIRGLEQVIISILVTLQPIIFQNLP